MVAKPTPSLRELVLGGIAWIAVLLVYGAVPYVMLPTLGQAVWSMGFTESFAHSPWYAIYASHFGLPEPAPIAFGLAGVWPASVLIRFGLHAADAYSAVTALWLGVALMSAYRLSRFFSVSPSMAWLGAVCWLTMPMVWAHAGYSMLSLGIALLAFYVLAALQLFVSREGLTECRFGTGLFYVVACVVAVFMDGYTFVMFAFAASVLWLYAWICQAQPRRLLMRVALPVHLLGFGLAYGLYGIYVGQASFDAYPLDSFRGWSLDLSYLWMPTQGMHWLPDILGYSQMRTDIEHFGDRSVWITTYGLPLLIIGLLVAWSVRHVQRGRHLGLAFLMIGLVSIYLALGPTLKLNTIKPLELQQSSTPQLSSFMSADHGVMPTGTAWVYKNAPAFNVMRATYRWTALGLFAFWVLVILWAGRQGTVWPRTVGAVLALVIVFNLPNLPDRWRAAMTDRLMFLQIDTDLVFELEQFISPGETVAFVPWGNDFLINYVAPAADLRTFNVGGDKNLALAKQFWPWEMEQLADPLTANNAMMAAKLLADGEVNAIVVPYVDLLWSAHLWPCHDPALFATRGKRLDQTSAGSDLTCLQEKKSQLKPFVDAVKSIHAVEFEDGPWFGVFRLTEPATAAQTSTALLRDIAHTFHYPLTANISADQFGLVYRQGWHLPEHTHVWSSESAQLLLPVPQHCDGNDCLARLQLSAFGVSPERPVDVIVKTQTREETWRNERLINQPGLFSVDVPLAPGQSAWQEVTIEVPQAISPRALRGDPDSRVLGVSLQAIELLPQ